MCGPDIPDPLPVPPAPPAASETAGSIKSAGTKPQANKPDAQSTSRNGIDQLRVDLNVPGAPESTGSGGFGSLLARLV